MKSFAEILTRVLNGVLNAINRNRAENAANNVADNVSSGGDVVQSSLKFTDLADKTKRD